VEADLDLGSILTKTPDGWHAAGALAGVRGRTIGPYAVLGELGLGAACVLGRTPAGELAALRTSGGAPGAGEARRDAFLRRARALAGVLHPGLAGVRSIGVDDGTAFLAERFCTGGNLADLLVLLRAHPLEEARTLGRDRMPGSGSFEARAAALGAHAAGALAALHAAELAHGRVRPASILFDGAGGVLLGGAELEPELHVPPVSAQTAPERLHAGEPPSVEADVYALGATLYELFTFCPPYTGASAGELARAVRERDPCAPRRLQPFLSAAAERVLLHALEREPRLRPTAGALERDLYALAAGHPVAARPRSRWRRALARLTRR